MTLLWSEKLNFYDLYIYFYVFIDMSSTIFDADRKHLKIFFPEVFSVKLIFQTNKLTLFVLIE